MIEYIRPSKFAVLYYHHVNEYTDITVITAAKRAILRVVYDVAAGTKIHPKVAMACLRKELITTARTNIKKEKDALTWMDIERVTKWKWKEMSVTSPGFTIYKRPRTLPFSRGVQKKELGSVSLRQQNYR